MTDMTPAQAAWLRKLRATGWVIAVGSEHRVQRACERRGWATWRFGGASDQYECGITPDGLAALEAHVKADADASHRKGE
jgi:hypothetical protein